MFQNLSDSYFVSLENLWKVKVLGFVPSFFGALIILIFGLIISSMFGKFAKKIVKITKLDSLVEKIGLKEEIENLGFKLNLANMIGWIVKWFFYLVTFVAVVDVLNIKQLSYFLENLVLYLPNVLVAIIILIIGLIVGKFLKNGIQSALKNISATSRFASFLGSLAKWAIVVFAFMAALVQLGIAANLVQILFTGFVLMLSLAGGLAFGLGGREQASKVLNWIEEEVGHKK